MGGRVLGVLVLVLSIMISGAVNASLTDGLIAYYPFNGNANDESGNGNHGTVYGATLTEDRFGNNNKAYLFTNNSYIDIGNSPDLNVIAIGDFSMSGWVSLDSIGGSWNSQCLQCFGTGSCRETERRGFH